MRKTRLVVMLSLFAVILTVGVLSSPRIANAQKLHASFGKWKVFTHGKGKDKLCYIASVPIKKTGNYTRRGEAFALVTYRPDAADEFSVTSGYPYKKGSKTKVKIDGKKQFSLFVEGERAWAFDEASDRKIVEAMRKGNKMEVRGTSRKGTYSADTYSLSGVTKALQKMRKLCK